jgi:ATP-dependent HslUV protease subunit HslV
MPKAKLLRATTVLGLRHKGVAVLAGDGQVTFGDAVLKSRARKIRKIYHDQVLAGFAGTAADAFTLFERFENKLEESQGNLGRAAVELAKEWRTDRYLRRLDAQLVVLDRKSIYIISGTGDVIEPDDTVIAIGSGGGYALAAARALMQYSDLDAEKVVKKAMEISASICIYTNTNLILEVLKK